MTDYRDLVIEDLADENAALRSLNTELETDAAVYRELAIAAFGALRASTVHTDRLQVQRDRLKDENARLRGDRLFAAGAAA